MRVPALRLAAWRPSFDWLEGLGGRRILWYSLYTIGLFALFLVVNFPFGVVVHRVVRMVELPGVNVDIGDARFAWWRGFELQRVRIASTNADQPPYFEASSLFIRPGFDGLLRGALDSVYLSGPMFGGQVDGSFAMTDGVVRASFTLDRVDLRRLTAVRLYVPEGEIAGLVSGAVSVEWHREDSAATTAAGELDLRKASITDVKFDQLPVPALHFDNSALKFTLQANRLEVEEFDAVGPELKLSANGQVALRTPVTDSVLNLKATIVPGAESNDTVKTLLSFLPPPAKGQKADAPRTISGTLAKPRVR
jgi:type II secretion system protein N